MHKALHKMDRLYVSIKEMGRGLTSVEDFVLTSIQGFGDYIKRNKGKQITAADNSVGIVSTDKKQQKKYVGHRNGKKNNCKYIVSSNWQDCA